MSRKDSFSNGGEEHHWVPLDPIVRDQMIAASAAGSEQSAWERQRAQAPTNLSDMGDLKSHLVGSHGMSMDDVHYYDESTHDQIPALARRQRNWKGPTVPALDHTDLHNLHTHEHTDAEYASSYPHTTMGDSHFHH